MDKVDKITKIYDDIDYSENYIKAEGKMEKFPLSISTNIQNLTLESMIYFEVFYI